MASYQVTARSEDGLSGEDPIVIADSQEQALAKYSLAFGNTAFPVVTAELID